MLKPGLLSHIITALQSYLQQELVVEQTEEVFGGDINKTHLLQTNAGKLFVKTNTGALADMFEKEYNGLLLLRSANALAVPKPLLHGNTGPDIFLVMEYLVKGKPASNFWQQFGHGLAALHKQTQAVFGLGEHNYIGTILQANNPVDTWADFYAQQRIMPLMQLALQQNKCTLNDILLAEKLCNKLGSIFPGEPPALLHGDLWGGNFMAGENGLPVMYDPAVYYGHREMDIAMTMLFGGCLAALIKNYTNIIMKHTRCNPVGSNVCRFASYTPYWYTCCYLAGIITTA